MSAYENPYTSPVAHLIGCNRQRAWRELLPPAVVLLAVAVLTPIVLFALYMVSFDMRYHRIYGWKQIQQAMFIEYFWPIIFNLAANVVVIYSAIQMLYLRQRSACIFGALVAIVPILSPGYLIGAPFGIWALLILLRKDTRAAFAEAN